MAIRPALITICLVFAAYFDVAFGDGLVLSPLGPVSHFASGRLDVGSADERRRSVPNFDDGRFDNPWPTWTKPSFMRGIQMLISRAFSGKPVTQPLPPQEIIEIELPLKTPAFIDRTQTQTTSLNSPIEFTWLGHSTTVLSLDGLTVITDPMFSEYCSPVPVGWLRRYRPIPCTVAQLPDGPVLVLISHNHYDHLDLKSLSDIHKRYGSNVTFLVPRGLESWFRDSLSGLRTDAVVELSWWQSISFQLKQQDEDEGHIFQVVSTPAQHWSLRNPFNRNKSLWSSWALIGPSDRRFFFAGDTGYCPAFKEIGAELGPFDLAAIPIGAYRFNNNDTPISSHVNPQQAVEIHVDVNSKKSIGVHWGTFRLGGEEVLAPRSDLATAVENRGLDDSEFTTMAHGETITLPFLER